MAGECKTRRVQFTTDEIAAAVRGEVVGESTSIDGASIDSRSVGEGELFVPLVAERDGHDFVPAAVEAGAAAYLTAREPVAGAATAIRVDQTMDAVSYTHLTLPTIYSV